MSEILQSIQVVDFPPPRAGRTFVCHPENAENPYILGGFNRERFAGSRHSEPDRLVNTTHRGGEISGNLFLPRSGREVG